MNKRKIGEDLRQDFLALFKARVPLNIIAQVFNVSIATVTKYVLLYVPLTERENADDFTETGRDKQKLHLMQLYAWLLADERECIAAITTPLISVSKPFLYKYLQLKEWERYLEGVLSYKQISDQNFFTTDVPEGYRKLIEEIFPSPVTTATPKELLEHAFKLMHAEAINFPLEQDVNKPHRVLESYVQNYLFTTKGENRFFDQKFVTQLATHMQQGLDSREKEITEVFFGISTDGFQEISERYDLQKERMRQLKNQSIKRLRVIYRHFHNLFKQTPAYCIEMIEKKEQLEKEINSVKYDMSKQIVDLQREMLVLSEFINYGRDKDNALNIVDRILPKEGLLDEKTQLLNTSIEDLDLSVRAFNCLKAQHINTLRDLVRFDKEDLIRIRNFGQKTLTELEQFVSEQGLGFGMDV